MASGLDPEQAVQRDAELQLAPEVDQADEDALERCGIRWTGRGSVTSATARVRRASHSLAEPEDQDADPVALASGSSRRRRRRPGRRTGQPRVHSAR